MNEKPQVIPYIPNTSWIKITIALLSFSYVGDFVIIPAISGIYSSFQNANQTLLDFILTGPMLIAAFSSILCGFLAKYIRKRYLLIGSYILYAISTCGAALFVNVYYLVTMRAIAGFAVGIIAVATVGLIADVFAEEAERSRVVGIYNGTMAVIGMGLSFASGFLAVNGWQRSFYLYLIAIPIIVMLIIFAPKTPLEKADQSTDKASARLPIVRGGMVAIVSFIFNALYNIICYFIAIYLQETNLGDSSTAGVVSALGTLGSTCACFLFSSIYLRVKYATPLIAFLVMGAAYIVLGFHSNIWVVSVMFTLAGAAYGLGFSYYYMHASMIVPPRVVSLSIAIISVTVNVGVYFSAQILNIYQTILHVTTIAPTLSYIGVTLGICGVLAFIADMLSKNHNQAQEL